MQKPLTTEQSLALLEQVASVYRGTLEEHNALQMALATVRDALKPASDKK